MKKEVVIYYDGDCGLCGLFVQFVLKREKKQNFKYASLQGEYAKAHLVSALRESFDSVVVTENDTFYIKSKAVFFILSLLSFPWFLFSYFRYLPRFITDTAYDIVAKYRKKFFPGSTHCLILRPEQKKLFLD